jgi:hypothetical protein
LTDFTDEQSSAADEAETPLPERALTTTDIAAQFAAKAQAETATADADEHRHSPEALRAERRDIHEGDPQTDSERQAPKSPGLSDVRHSGQFDKITAMVAELERQREALFSSAAALVEQLTLAGVTERLGGADAATVDRTLADLLSSLARMLAPDVAAAAQRQGRPLNDAERALLSGAPESDWRLLAKLLARLQ